MSNKRTYIAGGMSGLPDHNFPAFHEAAENLKHYGFEPVNPATNFGGRTDLPWAMYMSAALAQLFSCRHVMMLNGWEMSKGARIEHMIATILGLDIFDEQSKPVPYNPDLFGFDPIAEAKKLVFGDRNEAYGPPIKDFSLQANCLAAIGVKVGDTPINLLHIPVIMNVVKLCRESNKSKADNTVDIAGYTLCYKWCMDELAKESQTAN